MARAQFKETLDNSRADVSILSTEAASTMSKPAVSHYCCECVATLNRCAVDSCPCFAARRMCDEHCESAR
ncbi:unnamed protein product [Dracunculus medinensis]|uniref:Metallothionein n=1 Tax=Dracunculus medinensis TaxID=318479 RepID=A0A0N4UHN1_DRAME|nr:unnamed protein product [Dracunculus medinensis]